MEMTMQRGLYHHAVCHMDEVRQFPRPMGRVRFTPVDAPKPFADGSLGVANLDVVAIRRDENIDKSPRHVCNCPQAAQANNLLLARLGATNHIYLPRQILKPIVNGLKTVRRYDFRFTRPARSLYQIKRTAWLSHDAAS